MHTKERKITESLTTKEELLSFLRRTSHILLLFGNMVLLIHSGRPMVLKRTSQINQSGPMMLQNSDHSESVTYLSMVTIRQLDKMQLISKIQLRIL